MLPYEVCNTQNILRDGLNEIKARSLAVSTVMILGSMSYRVGSHVFPVSMMHYDINASTWYVRFFDKASKEGFVLELDPDLLVA